MRSAKSTAIIAVSIPISLLITFAPLNLLGVSLNIMSLGGLALGIGMLVDSSIVVLESIYRCREEGDDEVRAANRGTTEVRAAVMASTLTSIAVFFPMVFVEGIAGQAFGDLGSAVVVSLLASAAVALFFIPMLAIHTGLGLGVAGTLALVLAGIGFGPAVGRPLVAVLGLVLVSGFVFSLVVAIRGRLDLDDYTRRATGLWRWSMLRSLVRASGGPSQAVSRGWRAGDGSWVWVISSPAARDSSGGLLFLGSWVYLLLRFAHWLGARVGHRKAVAARLFSAPPR